MIFFDTETCGFHGPIVLIQWAEDDGKISLHNVWRTPVRETIQLIEHLVANNVCGFNLAFDWFHLCQTYTTLLLLDQNEEPAIQAYAFAEPVGRDGPCLKPKGCIDLMLHARKGEYQSMMNRNDIRIKRVPTQLAWQLAEELTARLPIKDIYFAKKEDPKIRWQVADVTDDFGDTVPEFKDIVLRFAPSSALKAIAVDALGHDQVLLMKDIGVSSRYKPVELGFAPFAMSGTYKEGRHKPIDTSSSIIDWQYKWPDMIPHHITHWGYDEMARQYAQDDVTYTRELFHFFKDPPINDDDSILATAIGAVRWHGFTVNLEKVEKLKTDATNQIRNTLKTFNFQSHGVCRKYMRMAMTPDEQVILTSTKGNLLEEIALWKESDVCECGSMDPACVHCGGSGLINTTTKHPAALRAQEILDSRHAKKRIEIFDKIQIAGRFHASFDIIGTLSTRMSGSGGGLNPQGIQHSGDVRDCFTLSFPGFDLCGGDFDSYEVSIMDAAYGDPLMHKELESGKKIHGLLGVFFFPTKTYDEILATKDLDGVANLYFRSKQGVFAILYQGEGYTLHNRVGLPELIAEEAFQNILAKYPTFAEKRKKYQQMFCSMKQTGGIGTKVTWATPKDYIESLLGFRRYFTLENKICEVLYRLAEDPPKEWLKLGAFKVKRRDRIQTATGSVRTALFAAAFALQAANMRAAGNHVIQSTGGQLTKILQRRLWDLQPCGIGEWIILPINIHDEVLTVTKKSHSHLTIPIIQNFLDEYKKLIPFIGMKWKVGIASWANKG